MKPGQVHSLAGAGPVPAPVVLASVVLASVVLAGCTAPVAVPDPDVDPATGQVCAALVDATPESLLGSPRRETTGSLATAWGDPPITLECGVPQPQGMTPTSQCLEVEGVGWWPQEGATGQVFTTLDRATYVQVGVPNSYGNTGDALAVLSPVVAAHVPQVRPCVG